MKKNIQIDDDEEIEVFNIIFTGPDNDGVHWNIEKRHVLTYEDKEGDWMLVGDVPWE